MPNCQPIVKRICDRAPRKPDCQALKRLAERIKGVCDEDDCLEILGATRCGIGCGELRNWVEDARQAIDEIDAARDAIQDLVAEARSIGKSYGKMRDFYDAIFDHIPGLRRRPGE